MPGHDGGRLTKSAPSPELEDANQDYKGDSADPQRSSFSSGDYDPREKALIPSAVRIGLRNLSNSETFDVGYGDVEPTPFVSPSGSRAS